VGSKPGVIFYTAAGNPMQPPQHKPPGIITVSTATPEDPYNDEKEVPYEVLFEYEGWRIERYEDAPRTEVDWISHPCPSYGWRYNTDMWCLMADGVCGECMEPVPDEIMGVWKLRNFDHLPAEDVCKSVLGGQDLSCPA
jgi:hypothetical protein